MRLAEVVSGATALLLDFDGPVCSVFAGYTAPRVAAELRALLAVRGVEVPAQIYSPHTLYVWAATRHSELAGWLDDELAQREVAAVLSAVPTPGARDAMDSACAANLPIAIVSNNADAAVRRYFNLAAVDGYLSYVIGRPRADPARMKPHPAIVETALSSLGVTPRSVLLVGDSTTDMEAAGRAGVLPIGYAKRPERRRQLADAGAVVVIDSMCELAHALKAEL